MEGMTVRIDDFGFRNGGCALIQGSKTIVQIASAVCERLYRNALGIYKAGWS
jgi:hypothetical protein